MKRRFIVLQGGKVKIFRNKRGGKAAEKGRAWDKWPEGRLDREIKSMKNDLPDEETFEIQPHRIVCGVPVPQGVNGDPIASAFCNGKKTILAFHISDGRNLMVAI